MTLDNSALTLARTRVMLSHPQRNAVAVVFGQLSLMANREASCDNAHLASVPQHPYVSTTTGIETQPSSAHFTSFA